MPDHMIDTIIENKDSNNAIQTMVSIFQGTYDLLLYSATDKKLLAKSQKLENGEFEDSNSLRKHIKMKSPSVPDTEELYHTLSEKV